MARKPRNYAAEYARRVQREKDRAAAEGRSFDRNRARGHKDHALELKRARDRRTIERWTKLRNTGGRRRAVFASRFNGLSDAEIAELARDQEHAENDPDFGRNRWYSQYTGKDSWLPIEFFGYRV